MSDLKDAKAGDFVALSVSHGWHSRKTSKVEVTRTTATRIAIGDRIFSRASGRQVGTSSYDCPRVEAWREDVHPALIAQEQAEMRLQRCRRKLADFRWSEITQEQADAVYSALGI